MKAFDTDILTEVLAGNPAYAERIANIPVAQQHSRLWQARTVVRSLRPERPAKSKG